MTQASGRSALLRAVPVLALAFLAAGAFAVKPATAAKALTKNKAMNLFYTKEAADAEFLDLFEGHAQFLDGAEGDARYLDKPEADTLYVEDNIVYREGTPITLPNNAEGFVEADCPKDLRAVGGGGYTTEPDMYIEASYPSDGTNSDVAGTTAWTVWAVNYSGTEGDIYPYVICVQADIVQVNF